jgi:hypothetical protein
MVQNIVLLLPAFPITAQPIPVPEALAGTAVKQSEAQKVAAAVLLALPIATSKQSMSILPLPDVRAIGGAPSISA